MTFMRFIVVLGVSWLVASGVARAEFLATALSSSSNFDHACTRNLDGTAWCWGHNGYGQLGDGTTTPRLVPVQVAVLGADVAEVSVAYTNTCALKTDGTVWCWGANYTGEVGDGTTTNRLAPVQLTSLGTSVVRVSAGYLHSCALKRDGTVWCWGQNSLGELGDGTTSSQQLTPVQALTDGAAIADVSAAGFGFTCTMRVNGTVSCWGASATANAQLASLATDVVQISASYTYACALKNDGTLWCWGGNFSGQLGDGTRTDRNAPVQVTTLGNGVARVATGFDHTCAVKTDGSLWCWGTNQYGALGDGTSTDHFMPVQVTALGNEVVEAASGDNFTCARKNEGSVWCWGSATFGALGHGTSFDQQLPVRADPASIPAGIYQLSAGGQHTCAIHGLGLWCWGDNQHGELGDGTTGSHYGPKQVFIGAGVAAGYAHTCAVSSTHTLWCWGDNQHGELGDGTTTPRSLPLQLSALGASVVEVSAGTGTTCALKVDGTVWCWGDNSAGQLGDGTTTQRLLPVQVTALGTDAADVSVGARHTCARTSDGMVWCWGDNTAGQLGIHTGTATNQLTPAPVTSLGPSAVALSAGDRHTCALTQDGRLWCWGDNTNGQLGDGTSVSRSDPVQVTSLATGVAAVSAGTQFTCARTNDGIASCWGSNNNAQLGDGTLTTRLTPTPVAALSPVVDMITTGLDHACVHKVDDTDWCWGLNSSGEVGVGTTIEQLTPVRLSFLTSPPVPANDARTVGALALLLAMVSAWRLRRPRRRRLAPLPTGSRIVPPG